MAKNQLQVRDLASEANLTADEVLLNLWNEGIDYVNNAADFLRKADLNRGRRAVGLPTRSELTSFSFWKSAFRLETPQFLRVLDELGFPPVAGKSLPQGSVRKLKAELRRRQRGLTVPPKAPAKTERRKESIPFQWYQVGHETALQMVTYEDVVRIHNTLITDFTNDSDPIVPAGVRNETLLQSAVTRPHTRIGNNLKYRTVEMAAAALLHSIVMDHPFHNGNKRTGLVAMLVFLDKNGLLLTCDEEELFKLVLRVAQHSLVDHNSDFLADREVIEIAKWIRGCCRVIEKGEVPIPFRTFRRILSMFNAKIEVLPGSSALITRSVQIPSGLFGRPRNTNLTIQIAYDDEGREVSKNTLSKVRAALHLDEEHSVDSRAFYQGELLSADDFIAYYRTTLRRLAKL